MHRIRRAADRGFTLIELMVVIVILGLLIGIVGPNIQGRIVAGRISAAKQQIAQFQQAIETYRLENKGKLPDSLNDLVNSDGTGLLNGKEVPLDPWDNEYRYEKISRKTYDIICLGADGVEGGEDLEDQDIHLEDLHSSGNKNQ